ncbi:MAG: DHA2 family efflux MFS transporter permease subunit [bacterium]
MKLSSAEGRWVVAGAVLGSGAVFLEGSVVSVALPSIARDLHLGIAGLQWVMNAYLLTLSALMLLGGALGDRLHRARVFSIGAFGFAAASVACALAPSALALVACRLLQGVAGALLVPNSLAMLEQGFEGEDRGAAIGQWAAWSGISTAIGPLAGGWLVESLSWRWVFAAVAPFGIAAAIIANRYVHELSGEKENAPLDIMGAVFITLSLAGLIGGLTAGPELGFRHPIVLTCLAGGIVLLVAFLVTERKSAAPLLPLDVFRSRQFTGANVTTLFVYAALTALFLLLMLQLQNVMGYGALKAGASLLPINAFMLIVSPLAGRLAERIGARLPMVFGAAIAAVGMVLFVRARPGASYVASVLPAVCVFGIGLSVFVAPLTAAVLAAVPPDRVGVASAVNNAVSRLAGLLATAIVPYAAGISGASALAANTLSRGFVRGMWISAGLCIAGALTSWLTISGTLRDRGAVAEDPRRSATSA